MTSLRQRRFKFLLGTLLSAGLLVSLTGCGTQITVLNPQGPVAQSEAQLIWWSFIWMIGIVLVVFVLFGYMLIRYRDKPGRTDYEPNQDGNRRLEAIWTLVPVVIVIALAIPTVRTTYRLEHPPSSGRPPVTIDVTAADWKWIFLYPQQKLATVNYVVIPAGVPIQFELTAAGPMNSFWVPALGGQEFAMPGRTLKLWLEASHPGDYLGRSANFSGRGFTHMTFHVLAKSPSGFVTWAKAGQTQAPGLTVATYQNLLKPGFVPNGLFSMPQPPASYGLKSTGGM